MFKFEKKTGPIDVRYGAAGSILQNTGVLCYATFIEKNPYETLDSITNRFPNFVYVSGV